MGSAWVDPRSNMGGFGQSNVGPNGSSNQLQGPPTVEGFGNQSQGVQFQGRNSGFGQGFNLPQGQFNQNQGFGQGQSGPNSQNFNYNPGSGGAGNNNGFNFGSQGNGSQGLGGGQGFGNGWGFNN